MKVSIDGIRRNIARAYSDTVRGFQKLRPDCDGYDEIKDGLDDMRQMIAALMCVYSDNQKDLMTDMADDAYKLPFASNEAESKR